MAISESSVVKTISSALMPSTPKRYEMPTAGNQLETSLNCGLPDTCIDGRFLLNEKIITSDRINATDALTSAIQRAARGVARGQKKMISAPTAGA